MAGETMYFVTGEGADGRPLGIVSAEEQGDGVVAVLVNGGYLMRFEDGRIVLTLAEGTERIEGIVYDEQGFPEIVKEDV